MDVLEVGDFQSVVVCESEWKVWATVVGAQQGLCRVDRDGGGGGGRVGDTGKVSESFAGSSVWSSLWERCAVCRAFWSRGVTGDRRA